MTFGTHTTVGSVTNECLRKQRRGKMFFDDDDGDFSTPTPVGGYV